MTDHTSTPQASRSRGAATAANLSDVGAILRGLSVNMSERIQSLWTINLVTRALRLAAGPKDTCVIDEKVIARRTHLSRISVRRVVRAIERQGWIVKAEILDSYRFTNLFPIASDYFSEDARRLAMEIAEKWSGELKPADVAILWSIVRYCDSERRATVPHGVLMKDGEWTSISSVIKRTHILAKQRRLKIKLSRSTANTYQPADASGFLPEDSPAVIDPVKPVKAPRPALPWLINLVARALRLSAGSNNICTIAVKFIAKLTHLAERSVRAAAHDMEVSKQIVIIPNHRATKQRSANSYRLTDLFPIPSDSFSPEARALALEIAQQWPGKLEATDVAVLWSFARYCDSARCATVSPLLLAEDNQLTKRAVQQRIRSLRVRRRLDVIRSKTETNRWNTNTYQLADASGFLPKNSQAAVGPKPEPADALRHKLIELLRKKASKRFWYAKEREIARIVDATVPAVRFQLKKLSRPGGCIGITSKDESSGKYTKGYKFLKTVVHKPRSKWDLDAKNRNKVRKIAFEATGDPLGFAMTLDDAGFSWLVQPDYRTCAAAVEARDRYWAPKLRDLQTRAKRDW